MRAKRPRPQRHTAFFVVFGVVVASLLAVAVNAATATRFPGPLRVVERHPWWSVAVLLTLLAVATVWERWRTGELGVGSRGAAGSWPLGRGRTKLLEKVERVWIHGVLDRSLAEVTRIDLGLEERPNSIVHSHQALLHRPGEPDQPLPPGTTIQEVAERFGGQLLILGEPGWLRHA